MRLDGRRSPAPFLAVLLLAAVCAVPASAAEPVDSTRAAAAADSLPPSGPAPPRELLPFRLIPAHDSTGVAGAAPAAEGAPVGVRATRIDLDESRKRGAVTLAGVLLGRRPALLDPLPVFGSPLGSVRLPDGGAPYRTEERWLAASGATDRSLTRLGRYGGIADLAATLTDPEGTGADVLDDAVLETTALPGTIRGPSDALAWLDAQSEADPLTRPAVPLPRRFRTTLEYRKGDGDEVVTGARFFSPTIGRGLMGSFSRHAAGGTGSILQSVSSRYRLTAGLPRWMDHTLSVEGRLFRRTLDMPLAGSLPEARAETERVSLAVRATGRSESRRDAFSLTLRRIKRTDVPWPFAPRERWEAPELALAGDVSWGDSLGGCVLAGLRAASTRVSYRAESASDFRRRIESARLTLGARRVLGPGGVGVDVAYDVTGRQAAAWDARASAWASGPGASARLDLESAVTRPTWIDLWSPYRADTVLSDTSTIFYTRAGNPSLAPRRQTGAVGSAALDAGSGLRLIASGAVHHVTRDFGWDLTPGPPTGLVDLTDEAVARGDGWISFVSLACAVTVGPVEGRAAGWVRGGADPLTPSAGSPPRRALDAEAGVRRAMFGGDLLTRLSATVHLLGARRGMVEEPAQAVWDGALELDFGPAGAALGFNNLFDRHVGSGVFDVETGRAEPLPGRTFHFGVVWNLLD